MSLAAGGFDDEAVFLRYSTVFEASVRAREARRCREAGELRLKSRDLPLAAIVPPAKSAFWVCLLIFRWRSADNKDKVDSTEQRPGARQPGPARKEP